MILGIYQAPREIVCQGRLTGAAANTTKERVDTQAEASVRLISLSEVQIRHYQLRNWFRR